MKNKYFISTAIPYVNADPHIGFALELIQGDILARYRRLMGDEVFFVNGTDENALKNAQAAEKAGIDIQKFVDQHAEKFKKLSEVLNISNNDFIRTTEERHVKGAQKLWKACKPEDIYKKKYKGLYCVGCEEFKTQKDLVEGPPSPLGFGRVNVCPEHRTKPEEVEEENYFFKLSKYQKELLRLIESDELKITPSSRKNETLEFIRGGLEDFSISRSRERAKNWGISVPGDESQIMYVWFDALTNYINALGYGTDDARFNEYWTNGSTAHLVGKGITRFHAIYWPAMLMSAGLALPKEVFVHGYVTVDGEKISKSLGNVIDPFKVVEKYGVDVVRYFLLREIPSGEDGDFSYKKLEDRYNGDLANGLGNLVQRVATLIERGFEGGQGFYKESGTVELAANKFVESFQLHQALSSIWLLVDMANLHINNEAPWALIKNDPDKFEKTMMHTLNMINLIRYNLQPFMPETAEKIREIFSFPESKEIPGNHKFIVQKTTGLFPRLG